MDDPWNEANLARVAGDLETAATIYLDALPLKPVPARHHLGVVLSALGRTDEAEHYYREALSLGPHYTVAEHSLALLLLSVGRYGEGWNAYESRRRIPELQTPSPALPCPEWMGEPLAGKRILVFGEQGFGDQIMFARFLAPLRALGAEVAYICAPSLQRLIPGAISVAAGDALPQAHYWTLAATLPLRLSVDLANLPPPVDLGIPTSEGGGVGVVAAGSPAHGHDALRSLHGADAQALRALGQDLSVEATGAADFLDTAQRIAGLDLVISVDTATAHLAASLGKRTWILLQSRYTDWRWGRVGVSSAWYPSARLYRQAGEGWDSTLDAIRGDLAALGS